MKKGQLLVASLAVSAMFTGVNPMNALAANYVPIAEAGENAIDWVKSTDGNWYLDVIDYDESKCLVKPLTSTMKTGDVVVPDSIDGYEVVGIGSSAWNNASGLISIQLPATVKELGDKAFYGCVKLTSINLENVQVIGKSAFYNNKALTSVQLGNMHSIGQGAFTMCKSLADFKCGNVETVGTGVFGACDALQTIEFGNVGIIEGAFDEGSESILSIKLGNVNKIGDRAFYGMTALKMVEMGSIQELGEAAFHSCEALETVRWTNNLTAIPDQVFQNCKSLKVIDLGSVTSIGNLAFYGCESLDYLFIPDSVTSIHMGGFNSHRTSVTPCDNTVEFEGDTDVNIAGVSGNDAIINKIVAPYNSSIMNKIREYGGKTISLNDESKFVVYLTTSVGLDGIVVEVGYTGEQESADGNWIYADTGNGGLAVRPTDSNKTGDVTIPESIGGKPVIELYPGAFADSDITGVTIPGGITNIGNGAFAGTGNLGHIYFPAGNNIIGNGAFTGAGGNVGGATVHAPGGSGVSGWAGNNGFGTSTDMSGAGDTSGIGGGSGETVEKIDVTLYRNDGTSDIYKTVQVEKDKPLSGVENPVRDGFEFTGWYTEEDCINKFTGNVTSNMNLYAGWKEKTGESTGGAELIPNSKEEVTYHPDIETDEAYIGTSKKVEVYVSQGQDIAVRLPFKVVADGRRGVENKADIEIEVKANISGADNIKVVPQAEFEMTTTGKNPIKAHVTQEQTEFNVKKDGQSTLELGKIVNGKVVINDLSAGFWEGAYTYTISVEGLKVEDSEENNGEIEVTP